MTFNQTHKTKSKYQFNYDGSIYERFVFILKLYVQTKADMKRLLVSVDEPRILKEEFKRTLKNNLELLNYSWKQTIKKQEIYSKHVRDL